MTPVWGGRADAAYAALVDAYWDRRRGLFRVVAPQRRLARLPWHYWWQAHALAAVVQAFLRTGQGSERDRAVAHVAGILRRNGGSLRNAYYDDLAWMGLALHDAQARAGLDVQPLLQALWAELLSGHDPDRGALVWRRGDDYRNVPTNGPTAVLAARLGAPGLARSLTDWLHRTCVDAQGRVLDGVRGDGTVYAAQFTYNYGTVVGADLALHASTGEPALLDRARRTAQAAARLADPATGLLPDEGGGDAGLFKGILASHLGDCVAATGDPLVRQLLLVNGEAVATALSRGAGLVGSDWSRVPDRPVDLSAQLSAVLLLGALAALEAAGSLAP